MLSKTELMTGAVCSPVASGGSLFLFHTLLQFWKVDELRILNQLTPSEKSRYNRFRTTKRKHAFLVGRSVARKALSYVSGLPFQAIRLEVGKEGYPYAANPELSKLRFSLSHSDTSLVAAVGTASHVGIDVEDINGQVSYETLLRQYFSPREQADWTTASGKQPLKTFLRGWTRKEAAWKCLAHRGLADWSDLTVPFHDRPYGKVSVQEEVSTIELSSFTWQPMPHAVASVVSEGNQVPILLMLSGSVR
jgi:phosphopantetheinyl transferase